MTDLAKFIDFKPIPGGYVYRRPNAWVFGSGAHYLANERQKAEILATITSSSRHLLWIIAASWAGLSVFLGTGAFLLTSHSAAGLRSVLVAAASIFSLYAALLISRRVLLSRLRPLIDELPKTNEQITMDDVRSAMPTVVLSPVRQRILKICLAIMPVILVGLLFSRAMDMHAETHQPILQALYLANADFAGLLIFFYAAIWLGLFLMRRRFTLTQVQKAS